MDNVVLSHGRVTFTLPNDLEERRDYVLLFDGVAPSHSQKFLIVESDEGLFVEEDNEQVVVVVEHFEVEFQPGAILAEMERIEFVG